MPALVMETYTEPVRSTRLAIYIEPRGRCSADQTAEKSPKPTRGAPGVEVGPNGLVVTAPGQGLDRFSEIGDSARARQPIHHHAAAC
jgi:hypothetical protein